MIIILAGVVQWTTSSTTLIDGVTISAGTVDVNGSADGLILDADGDTTIDGATANTITFKIGGADDFTMTTNALNVLAASSIIGASSNVYPCEPTATQQALSGAGAINVTTSYTAFTSTGTGDVLTMADGNAIGQIKEVMYVAEGAGADTGVITPANLSGGTTVTLATVGEIVTFKWDGTNWVVQKLWNPGTPGTPPVLA